MTPLLTDRSQIIFMVDKLVNKKKRRPAPARASESGDSELLPRRRMSVTERERCIVDGAITFFSEHGFDAQMRELAAAIGVTHTLVYHYFPTKQALVDRVYQEVFTGRWKSEWEALLDDPALEVEDKMVRFYADYARTVLTREFVRILIFSGLTDRSITDRFFDMLGKRLFPRLIRETRRYRGVSSRARPTAREYELLMGLHGGVFYGGMRWFVYGAAVHEDRPALDDAAFIADRVHSYLEKSRHLDPRATGRR
jgi:AcrR family transcriptional regulator